VKLLAVQAQNFRSFEHLELNLDHEGLIAVVGPNGAGKSTIFAAVEWGLYGARGRGTIPVRRDGAPESTSCWVKVHFEVGGRSYAVQRIDGEEAQLLALPSGEPLCTGREETSRQVSTLMGLTREMFRGTFYARQREVQALDSNDEAKRRAQVELLLGIERLRRAAAHAATFAKEQKQLVKTLDDGKPKLEDLRSEAEQIEANAQKAAPIVQAAEARVENAKAAREQAKAHLDALRAQQHEMVERRTRAQAATSTVAQEQAALDALSVQLAEAEAADVELAQTKPRADRAESLASQEREMSLRQANHEHAAELRSSEHLALSAAARLSDQLAALSPAPTATQSGDGTTPPPNGDGAETNELDAQIENAERELEAVRSNLQQFTAEQQAAKQQTRELNERIACGERAAKLDAQLAKLGPVEQEAADALSSWHAARARRAQLDEAIRHDLEHRQAVLSGEAEAACPTCKRTYDPGEMEDILAGYDRDLKAARQQLADIDSEVSGLKEASTKTRTQADALRALAADRRAIVNAPEPDAIPALRDEHAALERKLKRRAKQQESTQTRQTTLTEEIPRLRAHARELESKRRLVADLQAQRAQSENEARLYSQQLSRVGSNGYDPDLHARLRDELLAAQTAAQRCAELRAKADGLELLRRRLTEQQSKAEAAEAESAKLLAAAEEVAVEPSALKAADDACTTGDKELDAAQAALLDANRQASSDSEAVAAAHARLKDARERTAELREQRRELRLRSEIADALSAYREEASRRARPTLEHETGLLLGRTTRQRYSAVQLTDSYQLEIVDGREIHPLQRFSGGEQDLASLCLRLALSRTLAQQRGAESDFVLLDEVFGSQDFDRRRALLDQLHKIAEAEFRQVFVVSHTDDVVEHCDLTIDVTRSEDGASVAVGPHP